MTILKPTVWSYYYLNLQAKFYKIFFKNTGISVSIPGKALNLSTYDKAIILGVCSVFWALDSNISAALLPPIRTQPAATANLPHCDPVPSVEPL